MHDNRITAIVIVFSGIVIIGFIWALLTVVNIFTDEYDNLMMQQSNIETIIYDSQVVVDQDTLDVVDVSWSKKTVTLENGLQVSASYFDDNMIPESNKLKIDSINRVVKDMLE